MNNIINNIAAAFAGAALVFAVVAYLMQVYRIRKIKRICGRSMWIRFENAVNGDWSDEIGPFSYVQLTYSSLRAGTPDGDVIDDFAVIEQNGLWNYNGFEYTDVVIFKK